MPVTQLQHPVTMSVPQTQLQPPVTMSVPQIQLPVLSPPPLIFVGQSNCYSSPSCPAAAACWPSKHQPFSSASPVSANLWECVIDNPWKYKPILHQVYYWEQTDLPRLYRHTAYSRWMDSNTTTWPHNCQRWVALYTETLLVTSLFPVRRQVHITTAKLSAQRQLNQTLCLWSSTFQRILIVSFVLSTHSMFYILHVLSCTPASVKYMYSSFVHQLFCSPTTQASKVNSDCDC